ncbi:MAG: putative transport system ATP-binding protein [Acidimicrobiaceae bacterium]
MTALTVTDELVACNDVARTFGRGATAVVAVHGMTCHIQPGDKIAVTGPSGSGKSTALHLLAGLDQPTTGSIRWPAIGDRGVLRPGPVSMVFQGPSLMPSLDVLENVALPLVLAGATDKDARSSADDALNRLGLLGLRERLPDQLSAGQAQRVAVARALAGAPRLLLADEPTGQLDRANANLVIDALITTATDTDAALVVATHDPRIAARLGIRWTMADGRLSVGDQCSA